ncbi:MAG: bifunctional riboflavin kinase/FAD synthetase [Clostridia bacterium]|nr:bifunctional riboflavin kinase/FAD synthetase [Clostridia bacterium]
MADKKRIVLLGNFDGVHVGHRALIKRGREEADKRDLLLTVWTFDTLFSPALTAQEDRVGLLRACGAEEIIVESFEKVKDLSPSDFVRDILNTKLCAQACVCGYNYSFGRGGKGDPKLLKELCFEYGIDVVTVEKVTEGNEDVSSSAIRKKLRNGDIEGANKLLGRPYFLHDTVKEGEKKGRTVGMPTANFYPEGLCLPKNGVYATAVHLPGGGILPSVTNIGMRPTMSDGRGISAETYIIGFDGDLYGQRIKVEFFSFLRPERKFESLDEVSKAVKADIEKAKTIFEKRNG